MDTVTCVSVSYFSMTTVYIVRIKSTCTYIDMKFVVEVSGYLYFWGGTHNRR